MAGIYHAARPAAQGAAGRVRPLRAGRRLPRPDRAQDGRGGRAALGGVLFIDEAYAPGGRRVRRRGDRHPGQGDGGPPRRPGGDRRRLPRPDGRVHRANPGLASRFRTDLEFEDYTDDELVEIFSQLAEGADFASPPNAWPRCASCSPAQTAARGLRERPVRAQRVRVGDRDGTPGACGTSPRRRSTSCGTCCRRTWRTSRTPHLNPTNSSTTSRTRSQTSRTRRWRARTRSSATTTTGTVPPAPGTQPGAARDRVRDGPGGAARARVQSELSGSPGGCGSRSPWPRWPGSSSRCSAGRRSCCAAPPWTRPSRTSSSWSGCRASGPTWCRPTPRPPTPSSVGGLEPAASAGGVHRGIDAATKDIGWRPGPTRTTPASWPT